jgi:hypothetical protein
MTVDRHIWLSRKAFREHSTKRFTGHVTDVRPAALGFSRDEVLFG